MNLNIDKLERFREAFALNPREFAKRIGVSHAWYYKALDHGIKYPNLKTLQKIAGNLGLESAKDLII